MGIEERLIRYCRIDTQSDPYSKTSPSTAKQFALADLLKEELTELGLEDVVRDEYCYVYGHLPSNLDKPCRTVGFIAHMDTAPDYSGTDVKPRIIRNYDGKDIRLNDETVMSVKDFPQLTGFAGKDLMVTDGTTLLGADDKAGITAIMEALVYWQSHPEVKHGPVSVAFTPDEEVGRGTEHFDLERFGADFAYTMDGDAVNVYSDETFNAASAEAEAFGFSIHPGAAKNKMINALNVIQEFHALLPEEMRPEHTEKRDGFYHMTRMNGNTDHAKAEYIIRDHDGVLFEKKKEWMQYCAEILNRKYGKKVLAVTIRDSYKNMKEVLKQYPEVSGIAVQCIRELGLEPVNESIRGGTDGAMLSFMGLPCPNLGTGGGNYHGRYEYCVLQELELAVQLIIKIAEKTALEG